MTTSDGKFNLNNKVDEIHRLLDKFALENTVVERQSSASPLVNRVTERQHLSELYRHLKSWHAADVAHLMEVLTPEARNPVWHALPPNRRGDMLLELSTPVLQSMIGDISRNELLEALSELDVDDLNYLSDSLSTDILETAASRFDHDNRQWIADTSHYSEDQVGHWMSMEIPTVFDNSTLAQVSAQLQATRHLPDSTDKLIVINQRGLFCGVLPLQDILLGEGQSRVRDIMKTKVVTFNPDDDFSDVARAFERYDLISAPIVNERGKPVGRLTFDTVMDYLRESTEAETLNMAGVIQTEDLFADIWSRARNRWLWLSINLCTAFLVSRIVGAFEHSIAQLAALASLMPIVASMAGNTGNQTTALVIRNLAMGRIDDSSIGILMRRELGVAALNGVVWGTLVGLFALLIYRNVDLALVVTCAMVLSIILGALFGVGTPYLLDRMGRDPAMGSSVILTGLTDALGFFIFLLLATIVLL